jgi:t-SNARE complex subunit (syntaxin)
MENCMAQKFKEVAHLRTDLDKYGEGYDRIFGNKEKTTLQQVEEENPEAVEKHYWKHVKDEARQAYSDQQTQDTEGGVPCAVSFIAGYLAGYKARG